MGTMNRQFTGISGSIVAALAAMSESNQVNPFAGSMPAHMRSGGWGASVRQSPKRKIRQRMQKLSRRANRGSYRGS